MTHTNKLKFATMGSMIALATCFASADRANATETSGIVYGSGSSLAAKVYRELWDCWGLPITGDGLLPAACSAGHIITPANQGLYASVGSGSGKAAFIAHAAQGTPATLPQDTSTFDTTFPYLGYHYTGSDDVLKASDVASYNTSQKAALGAELQFPAMIVPVTIVFNGNDGGGNPLNIQSAANPAPIVDYDSSGNPIFDGAAGYGPFTRLNLSRQAVCGIFSGQITKWQNPVLTALNNGVALGTGQITVVHRQDGSGTTFLTTNGLITQCAGVTGPLESNPSTTVSYNFPWGEIGDGFCTTPAVLGSNTINWPGQLTAPSSGCSVVANPTSTGATFVGISNSSGVHNTVNTTPGAIGYLSPDFAQPVDSTGPLVANLGDGVGDSGPSPYFLAPTFQLATLATASTNPPTTLQLNQPLAWSRQGIIPNPDVGTYPIAGYTWLEYYECYSNPTLTNLQTYLQFHYTNATAHTVINNAGFGNVTGAWFNQLAQLIVSSASQIKVGPSTVGTTCTGNAG
jgi:phosphate transport system substrate-binding protein